MATAAPRARLHQAHATRLTRRRRQARTKLCGRRLRYGLRYASSTRRSVSLTPSSAIPSLPPSSPLESESDSVASRSSHRTVDWARQQLSDVTVESESDSAHSAASQPPAPVAELASAGAPVSSLWRSNVGGQSSHRVWVSSTEDRVQVKGGPRFAIDTAPNMHGFVGYLASAARLAASWALLRES